MSVKTSSRVAESLSCCTAGDFADELKLVFRQLPE